MQKKQVISFIDNIGRVVIGRLKSEDDKSLEVINPAVVNVQIKQDNNQLAVQLLPLFFKEFISPSKKNEGIEWTFQKSNIVTSSNLELDDNIMNQYVGIFENVETSSTEKQVTEVKEEAEPPLVKLFDE